MSLRDLVDADCGGANPLMRMGNHFTRDVAYKDDGIARGANTPLVGPHPEMAIGPPQTFKMDALLNEMREMDRQNSHQIINRAPPVIAEVINSSNNNDTSFFDQQITARNMAMAPSDNTWSMTTMRAPLMNIPMQIQQHNLPLQQQQQQPTTNDFFEQAIADAHTQFDSNGQIREMQAGPSTTMDWIDQSTSNNAISTDDYNQQFWQRLQDEWTKLSREEETAHPWLSEFTNYHDAYKEYPFSDDNPMANVDNVLEKGKQFLANGDIPSAVICFEAAVKQDSSNAEAWQLLGTTQAENENDPRAIAALKKSIELNPNNPQVLMALGFSYTNESLQSHALRMLVDWLRINPKYKHLVPQNFMPSEDGVGAMTSSAIHGPTLREVEAIFQQAVQLNPQQIDPEVQEALGMMYNLSSEYDKAVECYKAGLSVQPGNAKLWNRLGASNANGNRPEEAVAAYKKALVIEPGFIRARYNVGIICINLKSYDEAVEQFLSALNYQSNTASRSVTGVQAVGGGLGSSSAAQMSDSIWSTMRIAISLLGRHDLQVHIDNKDLHALNMAFGTSELDSTD